MADRRSRLAASLLAFLTAISIWLSLGITLGGDTSRIAALLSFSTLALLAVTVTVAVWFARLQLEQVWPLAISLLLWLPYLPIEVPASFLLWDGPIEAIVWLLIGAGLIVARPRAVPSILTNPSTAPWMAALLVAVSSLVVFSQVRNVIPGGDEPHYLAATQSLIHDADLRVANNYERGEYLEYFPGRLEPHFLKRSTSGEIYSIHAPGVSVVVLPAFAIAGYPGAVFTMVAFAALSAALAWRLAFRATCLAKAGGDGGGSIGGAWLGVIGVFISAPYFFHTFTIYPEVVGGLCVLIGVWLLIELALGREPSPRALLIAGTMLALLPWLHSRFAVLAGMIGLLVMARMATRSAVLPRITAFLAVPFVSAAGWFAFFYLIWGSPSPSAPYGPDTGTSAAYILRGLIGLLVDQQFGVVTTAPIYALAFVGAAAMFRVQPRLTAELAVIVVTYVITVASYAMWWGGAAAPGRFLAAILPLAALPIAVAVSRSTTLRTVTLVLVVVSVALILPRAFEDYGRFIYNNRSGIDATLGWLTANVDLPAALPSVHRSGGSVAVRHALIWIAGLAAVIGMVSVMARRWGSGVRFSAAAVVSAIAVMSCAQLTWTAADVTPFATTRELAVLERLRPSLHTTIVDLASWLPQSVERLLNRLTITRHGSEMRINRLPAGDYELSATSAATSPGSVRIYLGRNDGPIEQPALDDLRGPAPFRLRLSVMARTVNFRIEAGPGGDNAELTLRPVGTVRAASRHAATRAARFGRARAFFFDDWAYPERDGFWTRANGSTTVVIDSDDETRGAGLPMSITAGAVPTTIRLSAGGWEESLVLNAGQKQEVTLPSAERNTWALRIQSGSGFRPSDREPGNQDVRSLAAWIALLRAR